MCDTHVDLCAGAYILYVNIWHENTTYILQAIEIVLNVACFIQTPLFLSCVDIGAIDSAYIVHTYLKTYYISYYRLFHN